MICGVCKLTDGCCYTSMPPQVKCTITGSFHLYDDVCDCSADRMAKETEETATVAGIALPAETEYVFEGWLSTEIANAITACTSCLVCGDSIPISCYESSPKICNTCKKTIKFIKERFKEEIDNYEL